ncbi:MAG: hypothetical protein JNJ73_10920 [Hyphomonadaceae bacterium]|nr:hypothetical protein [Hyphomonadaceae bacterium]
MSLNKTLLRLFHEIRREAKRNPDFADRIDAVLRTHDSRRDVSDDLIEEMEAPVAEEAPAPAVSPNTSFGAPPPGRLKKKPKAAPPPVAINPVGLFQREGADALQSALSAFDQATLAAIVAEHNLDPSGETRGFDRDALAAHVLAQSVARAERDRKLFDY